MSSGPGMVRPMSGARILEPEHPRMLPPLRDENRPFWTGGAAGQLLIQHCAACERWVHPPVTDCPACGGPLEARPVSGRGTIFTFTVDEQQFHPDVPPPYNIAVVVLDEQDDLRLPTNIVGCQPDALGIGMAVQVAFERTDDIYVPVFEPVG